MVNENEQHTVVGSPLYSRVRFNGDKVIFSEEREYTEQQAREKYPHLDFDDLRRRSLDPNEPKVTIRSGPPPTFNAITK